jgi:PEP-CTERM motif
MPGKHWGNSMKFAAKILSGAALAVMMIGLATPSLAATITYTLTGTGTATIGNTTQSGAFTATGIGDTTSVAFPFGAGTPTVSLSSFTIAFGSTVYTATNPTRYFTNNNVNVAGFNDTVTQDVLDFSSSNFLGYNSISNVGPVASSVSFTSVLATNAGALNWTVAPTGLIFRAVTGATPVVPEPATWAMMLAGFGIVGSAFRRRQRVNVSFA